MAPMSPRLEPCPDTKFGNSAIRQFGNAHVDYAVMRVALDMRQAGAFGVGTYIRNVVRALARLDRDDHFLLIGAPDRLRELGDLPENFLRVPFAHDISSPRYYLEFQRIIRRAQCDVVHVPNMFWRPLLVNCPYVMTVHDLLMFFGQASRADKLRRWFSRRALRGAERILAVSKFTRNELIRVHGIPPDRID